MLLHSKSLKAFAKMTAHNSLFDIEKDAHLLAEKMCFGGNET